MKNIVLINHSDTRGGASVVTYRLMEALNAMGVDARMIVVHKATDNPRVDMAASAWRTRLPFLAEHADIFVRNGFDRGRLFQVSTARYGLPLDRHPWVRSADAVILNWVNQGMLSLDTVGRICALDKPVLWTMHDMWNCTGVCHHAHDCRGYLKGNACGHCPLIAGGRHSRDLSTAVQRAKRALYNGPGSDIVFVAVSNWLARCCADSELLAGHCVEVIPNAFPIGNFPVTPAFTRRELGLPETGKLVVMGAARLDDPVKNLPLAIDALNRVGDTGPDGADLRVGDTGPDGAKDKSPITAVFFGNIREPQLLEGLRIPYVHLGPVSGMERLAAIYAHSAVVLSTSRYETLPGTLIEGISAGCMAVATSHGGQSDIVTDGVNGYLSPDDNPATIATLITRALSAPDDLAARTARHQTMSRFAARAIAADYLRLIDSVSG